MIGDKPVTLTKFLNVAPGIYFSTVRWTDPQGRLVRLAIRGQARKGWTLSLELAGLLRPEAERKPLASLGPFDVVALAKRQAPRLVQEHRLT